MEGQLGLVEKGMRIVIDDKSPGFLGPKFEQIKLGVEGTGQDRTGGSDQKAVNKDQPSIIKAGRRSGRHRVKLSSRT